QSSILHLLSSIFSPLPSSLRVAFLLIAASAAIVWLSGQTLIPTAFAQAAQVVTVNAATYANDSTVAPNSIAIAFGVFKTQNGQPFAATTLPLPTLLGGIKVTVSGVDAKLFFTSNGQINFLIPPGTATGVVNIVVTNADKP